MKKNEKVELALLEAIYLMRWNEDKTSMTAVLTPGYYNQIVRDIYNELDRVGYKIVKK